MPVLDGLALTQIIEDNIAMGTFQPLKIIITSSEIDQSQYLTERLLRYKFTEIHDKPITVSKLLQIFRLESLKVPECDHNTAGEANPQKPGATEAPGVNSTQKQSLNELVPLTGDPQSQEAKDFSSSIRKSIFSKMHQE